MRLYKYRTSLHFEAVSTRKKLLPISILFHTNQILCLESFTRSKMLCIMALLSRLPLTLLRHPATKLDSMWEPLDHIAPRSPTLLTPVLVCAKMAHHVERNFQLTRADSDFDNSERYGGTTGTGHTDSTGSTGAAMTGAAPGAGVGSEAGHGSNTGAVYGSTTAGPNDSNIANRVDPRVDSTTGTHTISSNTGAVYGTAGQTSVSGGSQSTNTGPHDSNVANKIDPRVDSHLDAGGQRHAAGGTLATPGSGSAQNTAGPTTRTL